MSLDPQELERIVRLEEHLKEQDRKLDILIKLTEGQNDKIRAIADVQASQGKRLEEMAPTVKMGDDVRAAGRVIGTVSKWGMWSAPFAVAFIYWMSERWHLIGQLFKRIP